MPVTFDFSKNAIPIIVEEIKSAEKYVRIAIFQLHNESVIKALEGKLNEGLRVEIVTLPYDSINDDIRPQVEPMLKQLESNGAKMYFDKWNVGDPNRTTTAVGRWYSFHGKFMVTDKCAIVLSANLTSGQELDAVLVFKNSVERIKEFNTKFDQILDLFIIRDNSSDGTIRRRIVSVEKTENPKIFDLPKNISKDHAGHWIREYPAEICPSLETIEEGLFLTPFDCRGRDLFTLAINDAESFAYISAESFTDLDFSDFLVKMAAIKRLDIRVFTQTRSMDFTDRVGSMLRDLLAQKIEVRTTDEDLHAKLLITDKVLMVSSINLNKMNLGWHTTRKYWRENTESVYVCKSPELVEIAKKRYLEVSSNGYDAKLKIKEKLAEVIKNTLDKTFNLQSSTDARKLFASFILTKQLDIRRVVIKIGKITKQLMMHCHRTKVEKQDFISAMVLYYLSEKKQDIADLKTNINEIDQNVNLDAVVNNLIFTGFVERDGDYLKINLDALFS